MTEYVHEWYCDFMEDGYWYCRHCDEALSPNETSLRLNEYETLKKATEALSALYEEIKPYAMRIEPEVVYNKSTPSLSFLSTVVAKFATIMRDADTLEGK